MPASSARILGNSTLIADVLALVSLIVAIWSARTSRTIQRRTTEPILTPQAIHAFQGPRIILDNTGPVAAANIRVELIEIQKRPSALLYTMGTLQRDQSCDITASGFPDILNDEFRNEHLEDTTSALINIDRVVRHHQDPLPVPSDQMAYHLVTREEKQRLIISCAIPDSPRRMSRIFRVRHKRSMTSELYMCSTWFVGYRAAYLRLRFGNYAVLKPPPEPPDFLVRETDSTQTEQEKT